MIGAGGGGVLLCKRKMSFEEYLVPKLPNLIYEKEEYHRVNRRWKSLKMWKNNIT